MRSQGSHAPDEEAGFAEEQRLRAELLALNAAFEAARMGEEGEAFARAISELLDRQRR